MTGSTSPILDDNTMVIFGSNDDKVYSINPNDGTKNWEFLTGANVWAKPTYSSDGMTVFVGTYDGKLYAFNSADGTKKWEYETSGNIVISSPTLSPDGATVFVGTGGGDKKLYAINTADGTKKWDFLTGDNINSTPTVSSDGNTVFFGSYDYNLYAVNVADGTEKWRFVATGPAVTRPALSPDDATVFFGTQARILYALNTADGSEIWHINIASGEVQAPILSSDGATIFVTGGRYLYSIDTTYRTINWQYDTGSTTYSTPTLSSDGAIIFVGSVSKKIHAVNTADGSKKWEFLTNNMIWFSSPALSSDDKTVFIGSLDHKLYAINVEDGLAVTGWGDGGSGYYDTGDDIYGSPTFLKSSFFISYEKYRKITDAEISNNKPTQSVNSPQNIVRYEISPAIDNSTNGIPGLTFNTSNGEITGIPQITTTENLTFSVTGFAQDDQSSNTIQLSISVEAPTDKIFIGNDDDKLYSINTDDGTENWEFLMGDKAGWGAPTVTRDGLTVFVGSHDNKLYAVNTADGTKKWEFLTGGNVHSSPALSSDEATVFVGSWDNKLYAINTADGTKKWELPLLGQLGLARVWGSPTLSPDGTTVFVGSMDHNLYAVNTTDGTKKWHFTMGSWVRTTPAISSDGATVYVGSVDDKLYAVNTADGTKKWEYDTGGNVESSPTVSSDGTTVFVGSDNKKLYAINTADGTKNWEFTAANNIGYSSPTLSSDEATVFFGTQASKVYAINVTDGSQKWEFDTGGMVYSSPALSSDGATVFVGGSTDNRLYAINAEDGLVVNGWGNSENGYYQTSGNIYASATYLVYPPPVPIINSYTSSSATYQADTPITTNSPSIVYIANSFAITPALPRGLSFNTTTGEITGTPTVGIPSSNFDITATNTGGTSSVFTITVIVNIDITGKLTSDLAGIQGLDTAKITEANDIIAAVSTDANDAVAESTSKQALDKFSTATSFGDFNKGQKRSVFKNVMKAMVSNLSTGKFKMNDKAEFLKFVKPANDSIDLGAKLKDTIEIIKPSTTSVTVDMNIVSVYVPFEDGESQTFVDSVTGREFTMGKTGSDFTLTVADSSGGVHTIPPNYTGVADQEGDVYTYVDSANSRETIFVWGSGTASSNITTGQVQGDPYITTLAGVTYKMDDFTGFVRLLQGEYEGKPFTINAENKLLTKTEIKELLEWRQTKMQGMNFSENVRFGKFPAYFSKFYVSHGDQYAIVDANSLQVLETNYEPKLAHSIQLNKGYVWSDALKTVSRADLTVGELQMSMMSYEDKDIRNGFKLFNMEKLQNRSGALEHPIYVKDMKIRSIRSVVPIKQQSARKNKKVSKEEIIENGLKTQHTFRVF